MKMLTKKEYKTINEKFIKKDIKITAIKVYGSILTMVLIFALIFYLFYFCFNFFSLAFLIIVFLICAVFIYLSSVILITNWKINKFIFNEDLEKALYYSNLFSKLTFNLFKESVIATDITIHFAMNDEKYFEDNIKKIRPNSPALVVTYFYQTLYNLKHKNFKATIDNYDLLNKNSNTEPNIILKNALFEIFSYIKTSEKSAQLTNYQEIFDDPYVNNVLDTVSSFTNQDKEEFILLWEQYNY